MYYSLVHLHSNVLIPVENEELIYKNIYTKSYYLLPTASKNKAEYKYLCILDHDIADSDALSFTVPEPKLHYFLLSFCV